jgi:dihydroflavonol-4-reductase
MPRSLVTGATGHLGSNLVRSLLGAGDEVIALARPSSDLRGLAGLKVKVVHGDLLDPPSVERAAAGCARIFHAGALYQNGRDPEAILRTAVDGTKHVLAAAKAAGCRRLVYTSSNATIGYGKDPGVPLDERSSMQNAQSPYILGKCEAEQAALALGRELSVDVVVVNPVGILGPYDYRLTPTTRAVLDVVKGGPVVLDLCLTHVADIAAAHLAAAEKGAVGERYLIGGDNVRAPALAVLLSKLLGRKVRALTPPWLLVQIIAWQEERKAKKRGTDPGITRAILSDVGRGGHLLYDSSKARRELGIAPRGVEAVLEDTLAWLLFIGAIPEKQRRMLAPTIVVNPAWG